MSRDRDPNSPGGLWQVPLRQAAGLLLVSVVLTAGLWLLRPDHLPLRAEAAFYELELSAPLVGTATALDLFEEGDYLFLDTRPADAGQVETIAGAFPLRADTFDDDLLLLTDIFFPEDPLLLFGDGDLSPVSNIAARLQARGYENLVILQGGLDGWRRAGGDLSPVDPQEVP